LTIHPAIFRSLPYAMTKTFHAKKREIISNLLTARAVWRQFTLSRFPRFGVVSTGEASLD
jgi:hypothetical protein